MLVFQSKPKLLHAKLTALWAVSESGLGGLLHAIKIPFSGLFLGSFAIIIISYIAQSSSNKYSAVLKATFLVILIKAIASPHSPPMAYVAVLFQGVVGALIYGAFGVNRLSAIGFGAIALIESAFQKVLTLTLLFGMGLWESIMQFFEGLQNKLQIDWLSDLPLLFLAIYGFLYAIVGVLAGNLSVKLPRVVLENAKRLKNLDIVSLEGETITKRSKGKRKWLIIVLLGFAILVFLASGLPNKALQIVLRTLAAVILFLFVINPLFKYAIGKWVEKKKGKEQKNLNAIIELMPAIKNNIGLAKELSNSEKGIWKRARLFLINWMSLSLFYTEDEAS